MAVSGWWPVASCEEDRRRFLALKGTDANSPGRRPPQPWGGECRVGRQPCRGVTRFCRACVTRTGRGMRRGVVSPRWGWRRIIAGPCPQGGALGYRISPLQGFCSMAIR